MIAALLGASVWPDPETKWPGGNEEWATFQAQKVFCIALSETYGREIEYDHFWSAAERVALAEELGAKKDTSPAPTQSFTLPERSPESKVDTQVSTPVPQTLTVASHEKGISSYKILPFGVACFAIVAILIWLVFRTRSKGT